VPRNTPTRSRPWREGSALHGLGKAVLAEAEQRQAIVAALELTQRRRERRVIDARNLAHAGVKGDRLEGAPGKAGALPAQRGERGANTAADAAGGREARERERIHVAVVYVTSVARHDPRPRAA